MSKKNDSDDEIRIEKIKEHYVGDFIKSDVKPEKWEQPAQRPEPSPPPPEKKK